MASQEIIKRFAELAGICWHEITDGMDHQSYEGRVLYLCSCGEEFHNGELHIEVSNPDFCADPRLVLEVMVKREDWGEFLYESGYYKTRTELIKLILDTTGLLAIKAIEFMEAKR
jgi:hypothetical protein